MFRSASRTPHHWSHTWRTLMVPDWCLRGWDHPWHNVSSWYVILDLCTKFQLSSMFRSASRTSCPRSHTLRILKVPDRSLGGWGHHTPYGLSWYVIFDLCTKFQLSSMFRSASRTHPFSQSYLEDAEGSWLESWKIGSSSTICIILICVSWLVYQISALYHV